MQYRHTQQKGFSLVETLVAISILLLVIVVPLDIAARSLQSSALSREEITATLLAEEGIEAVIKERDDDALDGGSTTSWYSNLPSQCKNTTGCSYNISSDTFISCATVSNCNLYLYTSGSSFYRHAASGTSRFNRNIVVTESPTGEYDISSTVSWAASAVSGNTVSVTLKTRIFDQYE